MQSLPDLFCEKGQPSRQVTVILAEALALDLCQMTHVERFPAELPTQTAHEAPSEGQWTCTVRITHRRLL